MAIGSFRSTREVLEDHLDSRTRSLEEDLARNYSPDVLMMTGSGAARGHDRVRELASLLKKQVPNAYIEVIAKVTDGEVAAIEWTAKADGGARVDDGFDTFLIRDGQIVAQTIHYTVNPGRKTWIRPLMQALLLVAVGFGGGWAIASLRSR